MVNFDIAAILLGGFGADVQYAISVAFYTNSTMSWGELDVTVKLPGEETKGHIVIEEVAAQTGTPHYQTWLPALSEQLAALGGEVQVKEHADCEVCNGEIVIRSQFPDGVKFDPIDLAEILAHKTGHSVD